MNEPTSAVISSAISALIEGFCEKHSSEEFKSLCFFVLAELNCFDPPPILRGNSKNWAAVIVYALAQINFIFDKSSFYYIPNSVVCDYFQVKQGTVSQKAAVLRENLGMSYFDSQFSLEYNLRSDISRNYVLNPDGFIIPRDINSEICDETDETQGNDEYMEEMLDVFYKNAIHGLLPYELLSLEKFAHYISTRTVFPLKAIHRFDNGLFGQINEEVMIQEITVPDDQKANSRLELMAACKRGKEQVRIPLSELTELSDPAVLFYMNWYKSANAG